MAKRRNGTLRQKKPRYQYKRSDNKLKSGSRQKGVGLGWPECNRQWSKNTDIESEDLYIWRKSTAGIFCCQYSYVNFWGVFLSSFYLLLLLFFFFALHSVRKYWPKLRENYLVRNKTSEIKFIKLRCFSVIIQFGVKHFIVRRDMSKSKSTCRHLTTNQNKVRHELGK